MSHPEASRPAFEEGAGDDAGEELERGRLALARLAEIERELALARHAQDAKIAELEERLGWFEDNELDLRTLAQRRPWVAKAVAGWSASVKLVRRLRRLARA